ncbi:MAG TPA: AAA family ATPase [Thermoanaerobaculia bacterium]|nr:AAA family ATPase [Thermoanaerobaculia bacterium]
MFHGKCAYCETPFDRWAGGNVDHFRPKLGACDLEGTIDPNHYYWLAYDWSNLYIGCGECELNKKTFFPVEGKRAPIDGSIRGEQPLLIDPCGEDPRKHLRFLSDGYVRHTSIRGNVTIKLLGLNRMSLVEKRMAAIEEAELRLRNGATPVELTAPHVPYLAAIMDTLPVRHAARRVAMSVQEPLAKKQTAVSKKLAATATAFRTGGFLKRIVLTNFRSIRSLSLNITPSQGEEQAGWLMLLGENAAGKSSILQAVALALAGDEGLEGFEQESFDAMIRNGTSAATVIVETSADPPRIELQFQRGKRPHFVHGGDGYPGLVLGYGATRIADDKAKVSGSTSARRILNLFDPRVRLTPAEAWLLELSKSSKAFNDAAKSLKSLLRITNVRTPLTVRNRRIRIDHGNGPVLVEQLSAGYHAMLGLGIDIMQAAPAQMTDKRYASGIVILDEIDAHLHPRWKMNVVGLLRDAFPMIQFIVSTHEPLCLRGTKRKEVVLMRTNEKRAVEAVTDLPPHETMRVDQLLTSPLFGLHTTLDPEVEKEFRDYYALLAKPTRTAKDRRIIAAKKEQLSRHGILGYTRRDQLIYEWIDDFLAQEPLLDREGRAKLKEETKQKVLSLWRRAASAGSPA